jgi:hypothetical protein
MAATVMRDDTIAVREEEHHLVIPIVSRKRPTVVKHDWARCLWTPVLVENLGSVAGLDARHFPVSVYCSCAIAGGRRQSKAPQPNSPRSFRQALRAVRGSQPWMTSVWFDALPSPLYLRSAPFTERSPVCGVDTISGTSTRTWGGGDQAAGRSDAARTLKNQTGGARLPRASLWPGPGLSRFQSVDQDLGGRP